MPVCRQAGTRAGGLAGRLARMPARKQAGGPTVSPAKERDFLKGCIPLPLRGSIWRCRGSLWRSLPGLIAISLRFDRYPLLNIHTLPMPVCLRAGRQVQGQADWQADGQADKNACHPARRNACRFANLKAYKQAAMLFSFAWQHLALSWQLVAFLSRISDLGNTLPLHPSGRAKPKARTAAPAPSFFWAAERYRATDAL